jgi:excisionase family DNA binding protein
MDQVFSVAEACAIAHMGRSSFYELLKSGALTARKRGSRTCVLASELQRFIEALPQIDVKHPKQERGAVSGTAQATSRAPTEREEIK